MDELPEALGPSQPLVLSESAPSSLPSSNATAEADIILPISRPLLHLCMHGQLDRCASQSSFGRPLQRLVRRSLQIWIFYCQYGSGVPNSSHVSKNTARRARAANYCVVSNRGLSLTFALAWLDRLVRLYCRSVFKKSMFLDGASHW